MLQVFSDQLVRDDPRSLARKMLLRGGMVEFSISAVLDGLIQLVAFLLVCLALYLFLKAVARDKFETHFLRTLIVVAGLVVARVYLTTNAPWTEPIVLQAGLLGGVALLCHLVILKTQPLVGLLGSIALVAMAFGAEKGAATLSAQVVPEGPTFAEYMGVAQEAIAENKAVQPKPKKGDDVQLSDVVRKGLDALATLTQEGEREAMKEDFNRGMTLFAERKEWMDSLTPEEKQAYREEMSAFLAEQGLAEDRYSLAAIKDVNPTNLVALAELFSEMKDENVQEEERIRSIPESIGQLAANLGGFKLSADDQNMLKSFAELFGKDDVNQAIAKARSDLEELQGDNEFLATALAAMVQAESELPMDQIFAKEEGEEGGLNFDSIKSLAKMHWKREGKDPDAEWSAHAPDGLSEMLPAEGSVAGSAYSPEELVDADPWVVGVPEVIVPPPDPFTKVTTQFGIVMVPNDSEEVHEWIAVAHGMEMKGFVSLGDEVVVLRNDGALIRKGEEWTVASGSHEYHFTVESILKDRVTMRANGREMVAVAME